MRRIRLAATAVTVVAIVAAALLASPSAAQADPSYPGPGEYLSRVTVTQLNLTDGHGYLTVSTTNSDGLTGFTLNVPASSGGSWATPPSMAPEGLGAYCTGSGGDTLHYQCGTISGTSRRSLGSVTFSVPVTHSGPVPSGLMGTTQIYRTTLAYPQLSVYKAYGPNDTFPVVDTATGPLSTAEVRLIQPQHHYDATNDLDFTPADVTATVVVAPGESVTATSVRLPAPVVGTYPAVDWRLDSATGADCHLTRVNADEETVRCTGPFSVGRTSIQLKLSVVAPDDCADNVLGYSRVYLTYADAADSPVQSDTALVYCSEYEYIY